MSERSGRSKVRASTRRRRARDLSVSPGARSRSPLLEPLTGRDSGITSNSASETFTKEHLLTKLKELDVDLPSSLGIRYLRQVYDRLAGTNLVNNQPPDNVSINSPSAARAEVNNAEVRVTGSPGNSAGDSPINDVCRQLLELQSAVASINHRLNSTADSTPITDNQHLSTTSQQGTQGIPIDTLPPINIISPQLKKIIEDRKHVNLALLLIPGMSNDKETRIIDSGGNQIVVKSSDARLTRSLQIEEFRQAFALYRNIVCEKEPLRRAEFDAYFDFIESLHSQFGGSKFYDYHNAFSKKAAMYYAHNQTVISWAHKDTDLYLRIFAGEKSRACESCKSMLHSTRFCHETLSSPSTPHTNSGGTARIDRRGRQRVYHQGKEICNNYNTSGCKLDHGNSNIVHMCLTCKAASHSAPQCPRKQHVSGSSTQDNCTVNKK